MTQPREWSGALSVCNRWIDEQHRQLIDLCNKAEVCAALSSHEAHREFHHLLNDLATLVGNHFRDEETLLAIHESPNLDAHKAAHVSFLERLTQLLYDGARGLIDSRTLHRLIADYLIEHMLEMDMQEKHYLQKR
ncbi:MAG: Hemerythrin [Proteobacteria bacterium]|nr:Hemerythrin [Pseudomonadota bacterium]